MQLNKASAFLLDSQKGRIILHLLFVLVFSCVMLPYTGGPVSWDEQWYMDLSANPVPEGAIMFRYAHVYFQKLFMVFTPGIMQAAKLFWLFLIGSTLFQVFSLSYRLSNKNIFCAVIAVYFFFIQKLIFQKYIGITYPDFTVMFFSVCLVNMYFSAWKNRAFKLFALAFVFMLSFKSKETTIPAFIVLVAEFLSPASTLRWPKKMLLIAGGVLSVIVLFIGLDAVFLNQPFFGISPANVQKRVGFDLLGAGFVRLPEDAMTFVLKSTLFLPIVFYLWNIGSLKNRSTSDKLVYFLPMLNVIFIVLTMVTGLWNIEDRYFIPAAPLFCIFGALFFFNNSETLFSKAKRPWVNIFFFIAMLVLSHFILNAVEHAVQKFNWSTYNFHFGILFPLVAGAFIFLAVFKESFNKRLLFAAAVFLIALYTLWDLKTNLIMLRSRNSIAVSDRRFAPLKNFSQELSGSENKRGYMSLNIHKYAHILGRDQESMVNMYNIFYNRHASSKNLVADSLSKKYFLQKADFLMLHQREGVLLDSADTQGYTPIVKDSIVLYIKNK